MTTCSSSTIYLLNYMLRDTWYMMILQSKPLLQHNHASRVQSSVMNNWIIMVVSSLYNGYCMIFIVFICNRVAICKYYTSTSMCDYATSGCVLIQSLEVAGMRFEEATDANVFLIELHFEDSCTRGKKAFSMHNRSNFKFLHTWNPYFETPWDMVDAKKLKTVRCPTDGCIRHHSPLVFLLGQHLLSS